MLKASGTFTVRCQKCRTITAFDETKIDFRVVYSNSRYLGNEIVQLWEKKFKCRVCKRPIQVKYEFREYPTHTCANDVIEILGGSAVDKFLYNVDSKSA